MKEILHLHCSPSYSGWVLRLQTRLQESQSPILRQRYTKWKEFGLAELGMAFATRLAIRNRAAFLFSKLMKDLRDEIDNSGQLDDLLKGDYVYNPKDKRIFYNICVAFDALYFESQSAYDLVVEFVRTFAKKILEQNFSKKEIHQVLIQVLINEGQNVAWVEHIRVNRILFFHKTAPWIALQIFQRHPLECGLVVMKENLYKFDEPRKFITQEELLDAWNGFDQSIPTIFNWLISKIDKFEENEL